MKITQAIATAALTAVAAPVAGQDAIPGVVPMIQASGTVLDVSARGNTTRVPDQATIRAGVVTQAPTAAAALSDNAARMARVLAALKRTGIAARDVGTAQVGLAPQYRYVENQPPVVTGYQATNSVAIRFRDVAKSGAILDTLVAEGANQIDGPNLAIANPDAALDEARTDAVARARARAELYAKAAGLRIARIVSIAEAGENAGDPAPPMAFMRAARGESADTQIASGEKDVSVTLSVRFLLQ
ncbi:SIMPL domain-containing protein [Sphingomonas sp.]|jgi:hypothetical protein|uniref:SIMPL domain-containing protein n=1 Tax=Sphingomonas sp. TaxID=28214 RepID=UPI002ED98F20